jgi:hypothetical protein
MSTIGSAATGISSCIALPGWEMVVDAAAAVRCPQGMSLLTAVQVSAGLCWGCVVH